MRLGFKILVLVFFLSLGSLARGNNMSIYFDSKVWKELTEFSEGLIGKRYVSNICLPNTKNCRNKRFSHYPWKESQPIERIYYIIYGERDFEQYQDTFVLLVETDAKNIVLDTKLKFGYDRTNFSGRGILPHFSYFENLKVFFAILREYLKAKNINYDQATMLINESGLELVPNLSAENQRVYRNPRYLEGDSFESSSIEARSGFNLNPNWPDYIRLSRGDDSFPVLEFSNNGTFWVDSPNVK